ncbi:MAG: hypothetical protein IJT51_00960 [Bacteroidales bacterium]|nr:hypothetical protein [Bacteroidales bacterium]
MNEKSGSIQGCDVHYGWPNGNDIRNETDWECDIFLTDDIFGLCYTQNEEEKSQYKKWIESNPLYWLSARGKREKKLKRSSKKHHNNSGFMKQFKVVMIGFIDVSNIETKEYILGGSKLK